jgi:hypothetical protein
MIQLAYVSSTRGHLTADDIVKILVSSREKNGNRGITGMLLYKAGNVLQILEGEETQVLSLFDIIQKDERHSGVIKLYQKSIQTRDFPEWKMGFYDLSVEGVRQLDGFSEILDPHFDMHSIKPSAAAKLLNSFKSTMR